MLITQFGKVKTISLASISEISNGLSLLGIPTNLPTLVLIGGAGGMSEEQLIQTNLFFKNWVAPFVIKHKLSVVDGGTDSGIMKAIGMARTELGAGFPLIGVAVEALIRADQSLVQQDHTHLLLTLGADWGDEVPLLSRTATMIAEQQKSLTLLFNGGQITWQDAEASILENRPVLVAEGSGRAADDISQTQTGTKIDMRAIKMIQTGLIRVANPYTEPQKFMDHVSKTFEITPENS